MKKTIYLLSMFIVLQTCVLAFFIYQDHKRSVKTLVLVTNHMQYEEFKKKISSWKQSLDEMIIFSVPEDPFFGKILDNPYSYLSLVEKLIADETISNECKNAVAATMIALDIPDLAKFVHYINSLSIENPKLFPIVGNVAFNMYRASGFVSQSSISQQDLSKHVNRSYVAQVFHNIYKNPVMTNEEKHSDIERMHETNPTLSAIILETLKLH